MDARIVYKRLIIPLNMNIQEFIGIIIGDGHIVYSKKIRAYRLEIYGNFKDDQLFFNEISKFMQDKFGVFPKIVKKISKLGVGLKLYIDNKKFVEKVINEFNLPSGNKTFTVKIPEKFLDWKYSKHILRGIFESDGCLYFSKSKVFKYPTYPRIEIRSSSPELVKQIVNILKPKGYKIQTLKPNKGKTYKVYLSGSEMLEKWITEIGFSNIKNITKYLFWKKQGYYVPKISLEKRLKVLGRWPSGKAIDVPKEQLNLQPIGR